MAILSLNLGVFNLLPIPVLDGGHIFIIFIEYLLGLVGWKLTTGFKEKMMQTGFVLLLMLMGFVIYNDIAKKFSKGTLPPAPAKVEQKAPSPPPTPPNPTPPPSDPVKK
jgi:regulator of sigma E protease